MPYEIHPLPQKILGTIWIVYTFCEMAYHIAHNFIGDYIPSAELNKIIQEAYDFDAPLIEVGRLFGIGIIQWTNFSIQRFRCPFSWVD
jgi:hypothetical protein